MPMPDITKAQVLAWIATVVAVAGVLSSPELGLGGTAPWIRLVIAAALVGGAAVVHIYSDAQLRAGRAPIAAAAHNLAAAQVASIPPDHVDAAPAS